MHLSQTKNGHDRRYWAALEGHRRADQRAHGPAGDSALVELPQLDAQARRANDLNALKTMGAIPKVITNHYLTDVDAWFIRTDVQNGMKYFERRADSFDMDSDFDTDNAKFKAMSRYSFGWTDPRSIYGSAGA